MDLDNSFGLFEALFEACVLAFKLLDAPAFGGFRLATALALLETRQRFSAPSNQVGGVQALSTQQGADLAFALAALGRLNNLELVFR